MEQYGAPRALYTDLKERIQAENHASRAVLDQVPAGEFRRMCQKLGVRSSPLVRRSQGASKRVHGVHQDRLIKKLRKKGISSYEAANQYPEREVPRGAQSAFCRRSRRTGEFITGASRPAVELCHIFRLEPERAIGNDWRSVIKAVICNCGLRRNAVDRRKAKLWYAKGKESA
jgi:hypothetical protein